MSETTQLAKRDPDPIVAASLLIEGIDETASVEMLAEALGRVEQITQRAKLVRAAMEEAMLRYVEKNGPIQIGDIRYYAGVRKTTVCIDPATTLMRLLETCNGDFGGVCDVLAAQPFKHGAARKILDGQTFASLFVIKESPELKEGKPSKKLLTVNTQFLKGE